MCKILHPISHKELALSVSHKKLLNIWLSYLLRFNTVHYSLDIKTKRQKRIQKIVFKSQDTR